MALRYFDHRSLSPDQVAQALDDKYPVSDIKQAIEQLEKQGWVAWSVDQDTYLSAYTLKDAGLDYARSHKMEVKPPQR